MSDSLVKYLHVLQTC